MKKNTAEHEAHLRKIADIKHDLLSRTIQVGSVQDLYTPRNKEGLEAFLKNHYGPIQSLSLFKPKKAKFPYGRITFNFKADAEKVFGGKSLMDARKERTQVAISCPSVGYRGSITIRPALEYVGMMDDEGDDSSIIKVNTMSLSMGHWHASDHDAYLELLQSNKEDEQSKSVWVEEENISGFNPIISFNLNKGVVELDFTHCVESKTPHIFESILDLFQSERTVMSFRFKDLTHPMELCSRESSALGWFRTRNKFDLIFALKHPPRMAVITTNNDTGFEKRTRLTSIDGFRANNMNNIIGRCLGYRLEVSSTEINRLMMNSKAFGNLQRFGLFRNELDSTQQAEIILIEPIQNAETLREELEMKMISLSPRLGLMARAILDNHSCSWYDFLTNKDSGQDMFEIVRAGTDHDVVDKVLTEMRDMHGKTRMPARMFRALYEANLEDDAPPRQRPDFCIDLPRLLLTPTRVCLTGFELEMSNRFVRKFVEEYGFSEEAFMRVSIGDENSDRLRDISEPIEDRIKSLVLNGIVLNGRKYNFLAYSSSQLKEQSLWMVCPELGLTVHEMRLSMGDISCKTPSKYAARIGQCFSTTIDASKVIGENGMMNKLRVKDDLPDISSFNNTSMRVMEHSDGVGLIRKEVLKEIVSNLPFGSKHKDSISAIQIRYGGAKGVLVSWDFNSFKNLRPCKGYDVCLRPSMVKFRAPYENLEVITIAKNIPYYLNRNVILLGSHLGIPDETFFNLQSEMMTNLSKMLSDGDFAASFIPRLGGPDSTVLSVLMNMLSFGAEPQSDPFLYSCLHAVRTHHLTNLRKKSRIHVADGAVLIGGIDESGLIPEGCVFVQVGNQRPHKSKNESFEPLVGPVMVTKHPVMHPGDMRMLLAVDIVELRDKKNVILFSQHGERPEADKMSGSDLDGDQFAVTWDEGLFLRKSSQPMDYSPPPNQQQNNGINDTTLMDHFINHAKNDNLGRIAMLWMDHAVSKGGHPDAGCKECLELAKLHSIAVDFPKSGVPAIIPDELVIPSKIPRAHWREKLDSPSFHCNSIVGQLYDDVVNEIKSRARAKSEPRALSGRYRDKNGQILYLGDAKRILDTKRNIYSPSLPRHLGWKGDDIDAILHDFADDQKQMYETQLMGLLNQYKIKSEGEVVTGCILKYHKLHKRRRHDVSEEIRRQVRAIQKSFRKNFFQAVYHIINEDISFLACMPENEIDDDGEIDVDAGDDVLTRIEVAATDAVKDPGTFERRVKVESCRLAAAYYVVTYSPDFHVIGSKSIFYSFPWVVAADVIANRNN